MANINITIYYDPTQTPPQWSMSADGANVTDNNVVHLRDQGDTSIRWGIEFGPDPIVEAGNLQFSTDSNNPGIVFQGTPAWPGSPPSGNANNWSSTVTNTQTGEQYYFKVNAVITGDGPDQPLVWDPEVEEDPPRFALSA